MNNSKETILPGFDDNPSFTALSASKNLGVMLPDLSVLNSG